MLLDFSRAPGEHTSLDSIQELQDAAEGKKIGTLKVQCNNLTTLSISTTLAMALQHVTSLTASYNCLSTLQGLEAFPLVEFLDLSHNSLRVLDAHSTSILRRLRFLCRCDFSYNEIRLIDLDAPLHGGSSRENEALGSGDGFDNATLDELTVLNLAHNQLIDVPDFRCMPLLEELNLEYNRIEQLTDLESRLPLLTLTSLSIAHNGLRSLQDLLPLTVLAETLKVLVFRGNPCTNNTAVTKGCAVRPWLLWILPQLEVIDDVPLTQEECQTAAQMFRQHGELSYEAMEVMNSHHGLQLEAYLQKFASPPQAQSTRIVGDVMPGRKMEHSTASLMGVGSSVPPSLGGMIARLPNMAGAPKLGAGASDSFLRPQPAETVLPMMQKKLKQLSSVVEVLWKESMSRRVFATIVLQKYVRGFLTILHLPASIQGRCARIRNNLRRSFCRYSLLPPPPPPPPQQQQQQQQQQTTRTMAPNANVSETQRSHNNGSDPNEYAVLVKQLRVLESQVRHMSGPMGEFRQVLIQRRNAAAITIQKHYRGHVDRKHWSRLKKMYDEFVASLRPEVVMIQRVCRGYLNRVRLMRRCKNTRELRQLQAEVTQLRQTVEEMQAFIEQSRRRQRLERYADPEKAMEDIVSTYTTSRVSQSHE
ncbi:leucine-rich repeat protein (LRRP), putative [Trypanosoma cruzi marinkellei]|uniref:Leucine-rich repeat protein (LRRP), putative n=1 Tax=Trypanosoma cruzi marinkellei TaxID=85056 RepID=K2N5L9_TRYCR|nr:leucine-rich repeat protein (LRRP), putative [Trypanosoma cruzi marinkellei]